jgi:hypothetical protein
VKLGFTGTAALTTPEAMPPSGGGAAINLLYLTEKHSCSANRQAQPD